MLNGGASKNKKIAAEDEVEGGGAIIPADGEEVGVSAIEVSDSKKPEKKDRSSSGAGKTPARRMNTCNDDEFIFKESSTNVGGYHCDNIGCDDTQKKLVDKYISHSMRTNDPLED